MARKISKETWSDWEKLPENVDETAVKAKREEKFVTQIRHYKLITPLFGGGAKPKEADEVKIIRETEIRGQLRFWWRAIRGGQFTSVSDMKEAEDNIFGASSGEKGNPSKIQVIAKDWSKKGTDEPYEVVFRKNKLKPTPRKRSVVPAYAAFPLQPKADDNLYEGMKTDSVTTDVSLSVEFVYPAEFKDEIETTLFAWENFGGIGARTRRGFGAICRTNEMNKPFHTLKSFQEQAIKLIEGKNSNEETTNEFPLLENSSLKFINQITISIWKQNTDKTDEVNFFRKPFNKSKPFVSKFNGFKSSEIAWHYLITKLKEFRQYRRDKETGELSDYGKSQWSEPEALRYRMNKRNFNPSIDKFPRAKFGLPILFHMPQPYDRFDATLLGKGKDNEKNIERLSSPLILRPVECSDGVCGIALILNTPRIPPNGLTLTGVGKESDVIGEITDEEAETLTENGLTLLKNEKDVLKAFLDTI